QQAETVSGSGEEHRIFGYFDSPADRQKLAELVESALGKGLNQKQMLDYLVRGLGPLKGKIISSHPALIKEYIKNCRRND
ncbi:hypothetical protein VU07_01090, partial [Desulfobulbus sp. F4]|nr:hypothetical protein [Desulfobulbus sp. F4]